MKPKNPVLQNTSPDFQGKKKTKKQKTSSKQTRIVEHRSASETHGRLEEPALSKCLVIDIGKEGRGKTQIPEEKHQQRQRCQCFYIMGQPQAQEHPIFNSPI